MRKLVIGAAVGGLLAAAAAVHFVLMMLGLGRTGILPSITATNSSAETNCPELYRLRQAPEGKLDQTDIQGISAPAAGQAGIHSATYLVHPPADLVQDLPTLGELKDCPGFRFLRKDLK